MQADAKAEPSRRSKVSRFQLDGVYQKKDLNTLMIKTFIIFLILSLASLQAASSESRLFQKKGESKILINNRILARINGKPISTYDLMKKMDLSFYRQYPEYASSIDARYQFYQMSWRGALSDMIDKQLILADAQESKIEVTSGDVRQEIETAFGPTVIANLDKAGFSFDEAFKMMQEEIMIRRLISGRVHSKAIRLVTPFKVRQAYEEYISDPSNAKLTQWNYRILTIKERNLEKSEECAKVAYQLLMEGIPLDSIVEKLKESQLIGKKGQATLSNLIKQNEKEITKDYSTYITLLDAGMYSQPFSHKSRTSSAIVYRIIAVQEKIPGGIPPFKELESRLKEKLMDKEIDRETDQYLAKLRHYYHIKDEDIETSLPSNYQPFILK